MSNYLLYTRSVTTQLQASDYNNVRKRSLSIAGSCRRSLPTTEMTATDFARRCQKAFNNRHDWESDSSSEMDDQPTAKCKESLARISGLNLDNTLADEHRMKGWLPPI